MINEIHIKKQRVVQFCWSRWINFSWLFTI